MPFSDSNTATPLHMQRNSGIGLIEVLIGVAIILVVIAGLILSFQFLLGAGLSNIDRTKAAYLAEEGVEAVRVMRDDDYANLSSLTTGQEYFLVFASSTAMWRSTTTPQYVEGRFRRSFTLDHVYRDGNDDIASGGTLDPGTKKVTVTVAWSDEDGTSTQELATYMTNLFSD